ncbi:class I SAM-dependent methyltransferase [Variovorax paradoxus]|nr:class I SAM-dependent methyltransferase [Variovorax paradoxus]
MDAATAVAEYGGSAQAVQYHYDVGRAFYQLWLDESLTYSCALWTHGEDDTLQLAQQRKIALHIEAARAASADSVLDIGCGWGGLLRQLSACGTGKRIVGLTLSVDQAAYVRSMKLPGAEIRLESWTHHTPSAPYDAIISVGALEHFAKPDDTIEKKVAMYRDFFRRCSDWLAPEGRMSLQTIAYGTMKREEASEFINTEIFPSADLPTLGEIVQAAEGVFEITTVWNDRLHYARTFAAWAENLRRRHDEAVAVVGEELTRRYERYLTQSSVGFMMGKIGLLRLALRLVSRKWSTLAKP